MEQVEITKHEEQPMVRKCQSPAKKVSGVFTSTAASEKSEPDIKSLSPTEKLDKETRELFPNWPSPSFEGDTARLFPRVK